jgi:hypothetical protein
MARSQAPRARGFTRTPHRLQRDGVLGGPLRAVKQAALVHVSHSLSQLQQLLRG